MLCKFSKFVAEIRALKSKGQVKISPWNTLGYEPLCLFFLPESYLLSRPIITLSFNVTKYLCVGQGKGAHADILLNSMLNTAAASVNPSAVHSDVGFH